MKKKILLFIAVILISLCVAFGFYKVKQGVVWSEFISDYEKLEVKGFIHESALINAYTNDTVLEQMDLVQNGDLEIDMVKKDNEITNELIDTLLKELKKIKKSSEKQISNDETVEFGFVNADNRSYLYIYDNGTALLNINNKYYVYSIKGIDKLKEVYQEKIVSIAETDPYFQLSSSKALDNETSATDNEENSIEEVETTEETKNNEK